MSDESDQASSSPRPPLPMPEEFYSVEHDGPFDRCSRCSTPFAEGEYFQINKAIRRGECVFEYAFCTNCREAMLEEFSNESKANLMRHQEENMKPEPFGTTACGFCGKERGILANQDFTITAIGQCLGLIDSLLICFDCQSEMHELLSQHTKDVRRRFFEEVPGVPPDWEVWEPDEQQDRRTDMPLNQPRPMPLTKRLADKHPAFVGILGTLVNE